MENESNGFGFWKMRRLPRRFRRRGIVVLVALAVALTTAIAKGLKRSRFRGPAPTRGTVRRVIDGDTFDLTNGARVRLLDIDTPEFGGPKVELARRATDALKGLIGGGFKGREVRLEYGPRVKDRYERFLAYCFVERPEGADTESVFVNVELVRRGLARAYTGRGHGPRYDDILAAERQAREAGRGIWAATSAR